MAHQRSNAVRPKFLHRLLSSGWTLLALVATLGLTIWLLPIEGSSRSDAGRWIHEQLFTRPRGGGRPGFSAFVNFDSAGTCFVAPTGWKAPAERDLAPARWGYFAIITRPVSSGAWACTEIEEGALVYSDNSPTLTLIEEAEARQVFLTWLDSIGDPSLSSLVPQLRLGNQRTTRILWLGYLHNTISLTSALLIPLSAFCFVRRRVREHQEWRRTKLNRCSACTYDLRGLAHPATCPECGCTQPPYP